MSVTITTDLFCDVCSHWAHYCTDGRKHHAAAAYRAAKAAGWTVKGRHCTCPKCNGTDPDYWGCGGVADTPTLRPALRDR